MTSRGRLMVFSGPSGAGKDSVLEEYFKTEHEGVWKSVSYTTRPPRENECDGVDYNFISVEEFEENIRNGNVLEYTKYGLNYYGTPKAPVDEHLKKGEIVILKIEINGAANIKKIYPDSVAVFITPPSVEVLEKRLRSRGTESDEDIRRRLEIAEKELEYKKNYDHIIINDKLENAVNDLDSIVRSYQ